VNKRRYLVILGIIVAAVSISIVWHTKLPNDLPVITSLIAEPQEIPLGGNCRIVCNASDPDGDKLSYDWWARWDGIAGQGATVTFAPPPAEGSFNVTCNVTDGRGGEAAAYVTIKVRLNRPPTITSLVANADWITPSGSLQVTCNASDRDGDELNYEWTTDGGDISGTSATINWTAPQETGLYNVTVVVSDGYGGGDMRNVILTVARGTPRTIENLIVTPKGHPYLRDSIAAGCDYEVSKTKEYDIQCKVADTGIEVSYTWSCDDGVISQISEDGSMITWVAPNKPLARATVTIAVSDGSGNSVAKSIGFCVPSCACDSWC
jgi:hypothetical protein